MPPFDGIGANEYVVGVTQELVDFISTVDTPYAWELNVWYHTLNVGISHAHQRRDGFSVHLWRARRPGPQLCAPGKARLSTTGSRGSAKAAITHRTARAT